MTTDEPSEIMNNEYEQYKKLFCSERIMNELLDKDDRKYNSPELTEKEYYHTKQIFEDAMKRYCRSQINHTCTKKK